jgi:hypothetical protein
MSHPTPLQFAMPELLDIAVMMRQYLDLNTSDQRRALLEEKVLAAFITMIERGQGLIAKLSGSTVGARPADTGIDRGWGGLDGGVEAFERLFADSPTPINPEQKAQRERATTLRKRWIGGLGFLKLAFFDEWRESEYRLVAIDTPMTPNGETPREALTALGLLWALERLQDLHDTYGQALGIHDTLTDSSSERLAWEAALDNFLAGLRFHHANQPDTWSAFFTPYSDAIARGKERRRKAKSKAPTSNDASTPTNEAPSAPTTPQT